MPDLYGEDLAFVHDQGFTQWADAAANLLLAHAPPGLVVDLGCGSGVLAAAALAAGRPALGIDRSAAMLQLARRRAPSLEVRKANLLDADLPPCAAVAIVGEGLNYLDGQGRHEQRVRSLLERAFKALQPGGILLCDASGPGRAKEPTKSWAEGKGWAVMSEAHEEGDDLVRRIVTFRQAAGGEWRRSDETHHLRLLSLRGLEKDLGKAGFDVQRLDAYGPLELPRGHAAFKARKPSS